MRIPSWIAIFYFFTLNTLSFQNETLPYYLTRADDYFKNELEIYEKNLIVHKKLTTILNSLIYSFKLKGQNVLLEIPGLKVPTSFRRKYLFKRDLNMDLMDDIVRASIVFEDLETLYLFRDKLSQIFFIRFASDDFKTQKHYKIFMYKHTDIFSEATNMFEIQLQLCKSYYINKYTHNFYRIVRNIDHLIKHGHDSAMNFKIDNNILEHSYNPFPYFIIKKITSNPEITHLSGKDIIIKEVKFWVKKQLKLAKIKTCIRKYTFFFSFLKIEFLKLKEKNFSDQALVRFIVFMKLLSTKVYADANKNYDKEKVFCEKC